MRRGTVKVNVKTVLPLPEARKAQELSKTGHSGGKIVLEVLMGGVWELKSYREGGDAGSGRQLESQFPG